MHCRSEAEVNSSHIVLATGPLATLPLQQLLGSSENKGVQVSLPFGQGYVHA